MEVRAMDTGLLAQRLRWARREQSITLHQLSERCGRAVSYLSQLETGTKINPTKQTVEVLAESLNVRPAFLFGEASSSTTGGWAAAESAVAPGAVGWRFRRHFESLPPGQRNHLATYAVPAERFATVVSFLLAEFPENFTAIELAYRLGMSVGHFRDIMDGQTEVSHIFMEQLSRLAGVPITFFTHGTLDRPDPPDENLSAEAVRYVAAIRLALERNLSPERLAELILAAPDR
jgi:transcriptional regulator with XRE-family HTH domain